MDTTRKAYFHELEELSIGDEQPLNKIIDNLAFNHQGLLPAIAQDSESGEVLMLAWMNRAALNQTITTGKMTYWSRSRKALWVKGETSGHFQYVVSVNFDCDGDAILCHVTQKGSACHTNRRSCFYFKLDPTLDKVIIAA